VISLICLRCLAWANESSRNLLLASGPLVGSIVLMGIQFAFELRGSTEKDLVAALTEPRRGLLSVK
jgi:hypothetical protein